MKGTIHYDHSGREAMPVDEDCGGHDMTKTDELTKGGHYNIELDLDSKLLSNLVDIWANENLHEASLELYTDIMEDTGNQHNALHAAVTNDIMLDVLKEKLAREEAKIDDSSEDV